MKNDLDNEVELDEDECDLRDDDEDENPPPEVPPPSRRRRITKIDRALSEINPGRTFPKPTGPLIPYLYKAPLTVEQQHQMKALWLWAFTYTEVHRHACPKNPDYPMTKEDCVATLMQDASCMHPLCLKPELEPFFKIKKRGQ